MTISANNIVNIIPGVEGATGEQLALNGLMLTTSVRVPTGAELIFNNAPEMNDFFGATAIEAVWGTIYFNGFTGRTQIPSEILVARFPAGGAAAWLLGGPFDTLTIPQVQGITGTLSVVMDGYTYSTSSLSLNAATSYTAAAGLIETALNASLPAGAVSASLGGTIAPEASVTATGYISGHVLTVTSTPGSFLPVGAGVAGTNVTSGTLITAQLTGTGGGTGTYAVNIAQSIVSETLTFSYGLMTITGSNASGTFSIGQTISGSGVTTGTQITALGSGVGEAGTYYVYPSQTVASGETISATGSPLIVNFDVTSGGLKIISGSQGYLVSTSTFATGTTAAELFLTAQTGATISQGASAQTPSTFLDALIEQNQDWANLFTVYDPDDGAQNGPGQKLLYSAWTNSQDDRYCYIGWDTDQTPFTNDDATTSFGYQVVDIYDYSGTYPIWDPNLVGYAAFVAGSAASLNFGATNGRATFAFRAQTGLVASVTTNQGYTNLISNNYNIYGAFATASQQFIFMYPGLISGPFLWMDSFQNQIYMNAAFQEDYVELLTQVLSIPYNGAGAALMEGGIIDTVNQMVNYGAIRTGVTLSSLEIEEVNNQVGYDISSTLFAQGWYYQVQVATTAVRQARGSPPVFFFYVDGQSVQQIAQSSILLL
jgi:hypothetical protein